MLLFVQSEEQKDQSRRRSEKDRKKHSGLPTSKESMGLLYTRTASLRKRKNATFCAPPPSATTGPRRVYVGNRLAKHRILGGKPHVYQSAMIKAEAKGAFRSWTSQPVKTGCSKRTKSI
jgi:hypothetical protein